MRVPKPLALLGALAISLALVPALACAPGFTPRSVIENLRVLAVVATPLELAPSTATPPAWPTVTMQARTVLGGGVPSTAVTPKPAGWREQWSFCPFSIGAGVGYACASALPACDFRFPPDAAPTGFDAVAQAQACLAALAGGGGIPPTVPPDLSAVQKLDLVFRYLVTDGQSTRETVQTLPLYRTAPEPPNAPPGIQEVRICGTRLDPSDFAWPAVETGCALSPGADLDVEVVLTPGSAQPYADASGSHVETPVVSFYTTAGRFDYDRANGPDARVKLKYEEIAGHTEAFLYAVARDLRGGEAVAGPYRVAVR